MTEDHHDRTPRLYDRYGHAAMVFALLAFLCVLIPSILYWYGHWPRNKNLTRLVNGVGAVSIVGYWWFSKLERKYA